MDKIVAIINEDGSVCILYPAPEMFDPNSKTRSLVPELDNKTNDEILAWIIKKDVPNNAKGYKIMALEDLPSDRMFRGAWVYSEVLGIGIDIPKAQNIKLAELREIRKPKLEMLDVMYMRADESNDIELKAEIAEVKQKLRDVTKIPLPDSVAELKEFMPDILKSND